MKRVSAASSLAALAAFSTTVLAVEPNVVALDFAKSSNSHGRVKRDLARRAGTSNAQITSDGSLYYLNISVGTPPQPLAVYVDSGSSDLWLPSSAESDDFCEQTTYGCGALGQYDYTKSSSFKELKSMGQFEIQYGDGTAIEGDYFTDNVGIGKVNLTNVTMAIAQQGDTQYPVNGIMGVGYVVNEAPTQSERRTKMLSPYPNIISKMKDEGVINTLAYSIYMNDLEAGKGTILFGGVDKAKYTGDLVVVPVQPDPAYDSYYSTSGGGGAVESYASTPSNDSAPNPVYDAFYVSLTGVSFSNSSGNQKYDLGYDSVPVLLDSGTSIMYLPDVMTESIYKQFGARISRDLGPVVPCNASKDGSFSLVFGSGGPTIKIPMSQIVFPFTPAELGGSQVPRFSDGSAACQFGITGAGDTESGSQQASFILGDTFMSSAYVVFDMTNNQIGLAQGQPNATSSTIIEISSTIPGDSTVTGTSFTIATVPVSSKLRTTQRATATNLGALETFVVTSGITGLPASGTARSTSAGSSASSTATSSSHANRARGSNRVGTGGLDGLLSAGLTCVVAFLGGSMYIF